MVPFNQASQIHVPPTDSRARMPKNEKLDTCKNNVKPHWPRRNPNHYHLLLDNSSQIDVTDDLRDISESSQTVDQRLECSDNQQSKGNVNFTVPDPNCEISAADTVPLINKKGSSRNHTKINNKKRRENRTLNRNALILKFNKTELSNQNSIQTAGSDEEFSLCDDKPGLFDSENGWSIGLQVFIPFLIAGCGTVGAGLVLDIVQHWQVFTAVPQIFILVPALLGLKGNLEMTLASRLSTLSNLGKMDTRKERVGQVISNMALIQVCINAWVCVSALNAVYTLLPQQAQATVVAFLAALCAIILGWVPKGEFAWQNALLLTASGLTTGSFASLVLGSIMVAVVILSRLLKINPDNIATPIAASLGDLTTLALLSWTSSALLYYKDSKVWLAPSLIAAFILLCPLWIWIGSRNNVTKEVLVSGWSPVIFSMLISSAGGFILEYTVAKFGGIAVFQPVINGIGGNLVAVQASRLSTYLHQSSKLGNLSPEAWEKSYCDCYETFCSKTVNSTASRVLLMLVIPGHLIFMYMINVLRAGHTTITPMFACAYLTAAVVQVGTLLFICNWMVHFMWKRKIDPDNSAIPYMTALGDLLGTALLAIAFGVLFKLGDQDSDLGD